LRAARQIPRNVRVRESGSIVFLGDNGLTITSRFYLPGFLRSFEHLTELPFGSAVVIENFSQCRSNVTKAILVAKTVRYAPWRTLCSTWKRTWRSLSNELLYAK
jgi:hypothetical protein